MSRLRHAGERNLEIVRALHGDGDLGVCPPGITVPYPRVRLIEGVVAADHPDDVAPLLRGEVNLCVLDIGPAPCVVQVLLRSPGAAGIGPIRNVMGRVDREDPIDRGGVPARILVGDIETSFGGARSGGPDLPYVVRHRARWRANVGVQPPIIALCDDSPPWGGDWRRRPADRANGLSR